MSNKKHPTDVVVVLSDKPIIAQGSRQHVYDHPLDPTSLIKFPMPETYNTSDANLKDRKKWSDRFRRSTAFRDFLREMREYVELKAKHQKAGAKLPLCAVRGIVQTDMGLGLVYERVSEPDGSLSPNLDDLIGSNQVQQRHFDAFEDFFDSLLKYDIVVCDMSLDNLVYHTDTDGDSRIIWIDSFGSKRPIPLRRWFKTLNNRKIEQVRIKRRELMTKRVKKVAAAKKNNPQTEG
ncbi:MAG: YrbL family protein [Paracoccaceae bacterium]